MTITAAQLAERGTGIGGSDAAVACGASRWKTPYQLYLEKRGEIPPVEETEPMKWGNLLEPLVRQEYAEKTGRVVRLPTATLRHPKYAWMLCHPDGVTDCGRLYEGKSSRYADGWGEPETDQIPDDYMLQVQHNMLVTGAATGQPIELADIAVLISGSDWRRYEVEADAELQEMLIEEEHAFWQRVERGFPPPMETPQDIRLRYGRASKAGVVEATPALVATCEQLAELKRLSKELEDKIDQEALVIKKALGDLDTLVHDGKPLVTWRACKGRKGVDAAKLERDYPDAHAACKKVGDPYRMFLLKIK